MMQQKQKRKLILWGTGLFLLVLVGLGVWQLYTRATANERFSSTTYIMSTVMDQKAYGPAAQRAMTAVENDLRTFEQEFSLYNEDSDITKINAAAGKSAVTVKAQTLSLLVQAKELSLKSENAFALTIAPLTLAWGITSDTPHVLTKQEIAALLPLVNDEDIVIDADAGTVMLQQEGQAIDLGGIAKGTACNVARELYSQYGVDSALLSIGGNIYVKGTKPDGSLYRIGFRDPTKDAAASIASIELRDKVFAVSGGYERYFEQDGIRYHHILDPKTGAPAQSDIVSVGVIDEDGTVADFYSTTLFVWGKEKALDYFRHGGEGMLLDSENNLYVSRTLEEAFELVEPGYNVHFI